jgi:hypothetical protein
MRGNRVNYRLFSDGKFAIRAKLLKGILAA